MAEVAVGYGRIARKSMMEFGRGGACVPARVALQGASIVKSSCMIVMRKYILVWKRRCADVRAGTQAPPLRILLERAARGCPPLQFRLGGLCVGV